MFRTRPAALPRRLGGLLLALCFLWTWIGALRTDSRRAPYLLGDEATYLMQAQSLAWDLDLRFAAEDLRRFRDTWGADPDLILQSSDHGATLTYGKPFPYAALLATTMRWLPGRSAALWNCLLLTLAAGLSLLALRRRLDGAAPLWVATLVFASMVVAHTTWAQPDLFLLCCITMAFALLELHPPPDDIAAPHADRLTGAAAEIGVMPCLAAGLLLSVATATRPIYALALLPAMVVARSRARVAALVGALTLGALLLTGLQLAGGGAASAYGAERRSFSAATGYPGVDLDVGAWQREIDRHGNVSWLREDALEPYWDFSLLRSNAIYALLGRNVGLIPFLLPLFAACWLGRRHPATWAAVAAASLALLALFLLRPFNFYGGSGSIGNRYFLPLYGTFWMLPRRPPRAALVAACWALGAIFVWPLWLYHGQFPLVTDPATGWAHYRYVTASRWLGGLRPPHETSQRHLRAIGSDDAVLDGLWLRFIDPGAATSTDGQAIVLSAPRSEILLGSPQPLAALRIEVEGAGEVVLRHRLRRMVRQDGVLQPLRLQLGPPSARHTMWWFQGRTSLYRLRIQRFSENDDTATRLRILPLPADGG